ncbi:MAG: hypothetical protein ACXAAH_15065 [Promethearchaeota archaeon]|jgi:tetratricopeptide (TPR) repeat protein
MELEKLHKSTPDKLKRVEQLIYNANFEEALEIIRDFEKEKNTTIKEQLLGSILKGRLYSYQGHYKEAVGIGKATYQISQSLSLIPETIDAILFKTYILYFGKLEEAFDLIKEIEKLYNSDPTISTPMFFRIQADILLIKSIICHHRGDLKESFELANRCLRILEKSGEKLDLSRIYCHLGELYLYKSDNDLGLDFAKKSLAIQMEMGNQNGIAKSLHLVGAGYYNKGEFYQALQIGKQGLKIKEIDLLTKLEMLDLLADIYKSKGELDRALRFQNRAAKIAEKEGYIEEAISCIYGTGVIYRRKGDIVRAIECFKDSLNLSLKYNSPYGKRSSLFHLILSNLDKNSLDQAKLYLTQLENSTNQIENGVFTNVYLTAKALVLKKGSRIRHRTEAEQILKQITEKVIETPILFIIASVNLCDLFLEELYLTNNIEVLDEINPLISDLLIFAEKQNAFLWLAEIKLLQAKLSLIQLRFEKAKQLLTQAQRIAELHGLKLLASKISSEHDNLLEHLNEWVNLQRLDAPMAERITLASFDGVVNRIQGKAALELPDLIHEQPILLLISGEGGFPLFSTQFGEKFTLEEDLISGFLAAFNNFSSEIFSKGLDRAKFGELMILMQSAGPFSVSYLFRGQTYLAKQKLTKFTERIQNTTYIWETLNKSYEMNQIIELKNNPPLELLISEIFIKTQA